MTFSLFYTIMNKKTKYLNNKNDEQTKQHKKCLYNII